MAEYSANIPRQGRGEPIWAILGGEGCTVLQDHIGLTFLSLTVFKERKMIQLKKG
jgi:hypothetical protein